MADLHKTSQTQGKVYMYIQAASRQQLPAPVAPRERAARSIYNRPIFGPFDTLFCYYLHAALLNPFLELREIVQLLGRRTTRMCMIETGLRDERWSGWINSRSLPNGSMFGPSCNFFSCVSSCQLTPLRRGCWCLVGHNQHRRGQTLWSTVEWHV